MSIISELPENIKKKILPFPLEVNELIIDKVIITKITNKQLLAVKAILCNQMIDKFNPMFLNQEYYFHSITHNLISPGDYADCNLQKYKNYFKNIILDETTQFYKKYFKTHPKEIKYSIKIIVALYELWANDMNDIYKNMKNISKQINHYRTNLEIKCFDKTFKIFKSNKTINPIPYNKFKDFIKNYIKESIDKILNTYDMVDVYDFVLNNLDSDSDSDSD